MTRAGAAGGGRLGGRWGGCQADVRGYWAVRGGGGGAAVRACVDAIHTCGTVLQRTDDTGSDKTGARG